MAIVFACAIAIAFAAWLGLRDDYRTLEQRTQAIQRALDARIASANALLTSVAGMYRASDEIRPYELLDLSRELLSAYPFIRLISVSDALSPEDRATWESQMREEGFPTIRVRSQQGAPSAVHSMEPFQMFPIKFLEPMEPEFARLLGFDISSHPAIRKSLLAAIDSGAIETSELFSFADGVPGWLSLKAVYFGHETPDSKAERRRQLVGIIALKIDQKSLVADTGKIAHGLDVRMIPVTHSGTSYLPSTDISWGWPPSPILTSRQQVTINRQPGILELVLRPGWSSRKLALPITFGLIALLLGIAATFAYRTHRIQTGQAEALARLDQESEQRFRDYAEVASDWYWSMDANLRFDYVSDRIKDITGFNPEIFIGESRRSIVGSDADMNQRVAENIEDMEARRSFRDFQYRNSSDWEQPRWFSISGKPIFSDTGEFLGYRGTARDITAEMETREEMNRAREAAERANQVKSEFLATMSHELRTPLNAILGFSEVMKDEVLGPVGSTQYREYAENINDSGQHLLDLINDILDISKIGAGKDELDESVLSIPTVMDAVRNLVLPRAQKGFVTLEVNLHEQLPYLSADERKLKQVLLNLIVNAIKFTDQGGKVMIDV